MATHAPPPRRRPAAAAAAAAAAGAAAAAATSSSFFNVEPFQVSQQETGAPSTSSSSGDLLLRARAAAAQQQQQQTSLSADDEFHRPSRERSRSRGRLPTTADTATASRHHRSLSRRSHRRRSRNNSQGGGGPAATILEGFADSWETIMGGGIEMFRSEAMSLMQVRFGFAFFSFSERRGRSRTSCLTHLPRENKEEGEGWTRGGKKGAREIASGCDDARRERGRTKKRDLLALDPFPFLSPSPPPPTTTQKQQTAPRPRRGSARRSGSGRLPRSPPVQGPQRGEARLAEGLCVARPPLRRDGARAALPGLAASLFGGRVS